MRPRPPAASGSAGTARSHASGTARPPAARARAPIEIARDAQAFEEIGSYDRAAAALHELRAALLPHLDADLEIALALDEARSGDIDSATTRLASPLLSAAAIDSLPVGRRGEYPYAREGLWINGSFDGWGWYVFRARAELAAAAGRWSEAREAAREAVDARPMSGKDWLVLAVCAAHAGDLAEGRAAADRARLLDPTLPEACTLAGVLAWRSGARAQARERFHEAIALDSLERAPALALARLQLPGAPPDTLPWTLLTGVRSVALLTSPARPKIEELVQMDTPPVVLEQVEIGMPDSLADRVTVKDLIISIFVDESGRARVNDLPWFSPRQIPDSVTNAIVGSLPRWRLAPAQKLGRAERGWANIQYRLRDH